MSKKTLALILVLLGLTIVLVVIAVMTRTPKTTPAMPDSTTVETTGTPTPIVGNTVLSMTPNPVTAAQTGSAAATAEVLINTNGDLVTAVQLEIAYDPKVLTNMRISPGSFFSTPNVLPVGGVNASTGRITFMLVPSNIREAKTGEGTVATLTFTPNSSSGATSTEITILEKSLVSARGLTQSVLKSSSGTTVTLPTSAQ
ncbi:MAG: Cohesin protein [Patescibacteria group bacterium]|nr:Cohesin protein [Patescibacteria group bacterium]